MGMRLRADFGILPHASGQFDVEGPMAKDTQLVKEPPSQGCRSQLVKEPPSQRCRISRSRVSR